MAKKYLDYDGLLYFWQKIKTLFVPVTRTVNSKALSADISLTASDVGAAPTSHKSTATTYGVGDSSNYGHVKLSDSTSSTTSTSGGTAATPKAVKDALDAAKAHVSGNTLKYSRVNDDGTVHVYNYDEEREFDFLEGTALQAKIDGIAAGAEVNVQSDWNQTTTTADDYIKNKPTISGQVFYGTLGEYEQTATSTRTYSIAVNNFKLKTGNIILFYWAKEVATASASINLNVNGTGSLALKAPKGSATITYNELNDNSRVYAAVYTGVDYKLLGYFDKDTTYPYGTASQIETGTNMADRVWSAKILSDYVTGKVGSIPVATTSANGLMSSTDKSKLDGIASGAEVNVQSDWNQTTTTADDYIKNKPTLGSAAAKGVITSISSDSTDLPTVTAVKGYVDTAVAGATSYQGIAPTSFAPTNYKAGWYWIIGTAGTYCGQTCEAGDMIFCKTAASTYAASNFDVVQTNLDITSITNAEIDTILAA